MIEKILNLLFNRQDIKREQDSVVYMKRWFLLNIFGHRICIHKMTTPDNDKCLHGHPWKYTTLILYGGYFEQISTTKERFNGFLSLKTHKPPHPHRISRLPKGFCYTLVWMRPKVMEWGFYTKNGWKHHKEFIDESGKHPEWC